MSECFTRSIERTIKFIPHVLFYERNRCTVENHSDYNSEIDKAHFEPISRNDSCDDKFDDRSSESENKVDFTRVVVFRKVDIENGNNIHRGYRGDIYVKKEIEE